MAGRLRAAWIRIRRCAVGARGCHCAGKAINHYSGIRHDAASVGAYGPLPIDIPALLIRIVVPKIESRPFRGVDRVWVDQTRALHTAAVNFYIATSWLNREVKIDSYVRERERWPAQRNLGNTHLRDYVSVVVGNHGCWLEMQFETGQQWRRD